MARGSAIWLRVIGDCVQGNKLVAPRGWFLSLTVANGSSVYIRDATQQREAFTFDENIITRNDADGTRVSWLWDEVTGIARLKNP